MAASIVTGAMLDAVVLAQTKADVDGPDAGNPWARALERLWAVVLANFIFTIVAAFGVELVAAGDIVARIAGACVLPLAAAMIFAECIAVTSDDERWWWLLVQAVGGSIRITWRDASTTFRAILIFAFAELLPAALGYALEPVLKAQHVALSSFWSNVPLGIVLTIPLDVLIVLAFFDASGYRPELSCGE